MEIQNETPFPILRYKKNVNITVCLHFVQDTFFPTKLEVFDFKKLIEYFFLLIDVSMEKLTEKLYQCAWQ